MARVESWAAPGAIGGGVLLAVGQVVNQLGGDAGSTAGHALVVLAHVVLVFGFVGLFAVHGGRGNTPLAVGTVLVVAGTALLTAVAYAELAVTAGVIDSMSTVEQAPAAAVVAFGGPLVFLVGLAAFGVGMARAGQLPAPAGWMMVLAAVLAVIGGGTGQRIVFTVGAVVLGSALVWAGTAASGAARATPTRA